MLEGLGTSGLVSCDQWKAQELLGMRRTQNPFHFSLML